MICKNCKQETDDNKSKCNHCGEIAKNIFYTESKEKEEVKIKDNKRINIVGKDILFLFKIFVVMLVVGIVCIMVTYKNNAADISSVKKEAENKTEENKNIVSEFRGFKWGTNKEEIIKECKLGEKPYFDKKENCIFYKNYPFLDEKKAMIAFFFDDNEELYRGEIVIETDDLEFPDYIEKVLKEKYNWKADPNNTQNNLGLSTQTIRIGNELFADEKYISEIIMKRDFVPMFTTTVNISYYDLERTKVILENKEERTKRGLKEEL